jgi:hypothetical protein
VFEPSCRSMVHTVWRDEIGYSLKQIVAHVGILCYNFQRMFENPPRVSGLGCV